MANLLVVIGATEKQASLVIFGCIPSESYLSVISDVLQNNHSYRIRGVTRDTSSRVAQSHTEKGVEMVRGNLNDKNSLEKAFEGATAIYAVTDFWSPLFRALASYYPGTKEPFDIAFDDEICQGKNMVDAATTCLGTLERFVVSCLPNAVKISKRLHPPLKHYVSTAMTVDYIKNLPTPVDGGKRLWNIASELCPAYHMEIWLMHLYLKAEEDASWAIMTPLPPDVPLLVMMTTNLGQFVSKILSRPVDPTHTPVLAATDTVTMTEIATAFAQATGRNIVYKIFPASQLEEENRDYVDELADMYAYFEEYGFAGIMEMINAADLGLGNGLTSFQRCTDGQDWGFFLKGSR